jgi:hypothetical protein
LMNKIKVMFYAPPPPKKNFYTLWEKKNIVDEAYAAPCAFEKNCTQILYPNKPNP